MKRARWTSALVGAALVLTTACGAGSPDDDDRERPGGSPVDGPSTAAPREPGARDGRPGVLARAVADGPRRPRTPHQVAVAVTAAEDAVADPSTPPRVLAAAGHLQQLAYRVLGERPGWDRRVLARVPRRHHATVRDNVASRREFRSMHSTLSDTLPAWRIVAPAPARQLLAHYREAEATHGVDWEYLAAINLVETGMGRIRGTSVAGARGPMQFIPGTWAQWGRGDIDDPRDAVMAAARYLEGMGFTRPGGIPDALWRYNNHTAYVRGVTRVAEVMQRDPRAFHGYYHWQVYYLSSAGDVLLPQGYERRQPVPVRQYLARHPQP